MDSLNCNVLETKMLLQTAIFRLDQKTIEDARGHRYIRTVVEKAPAVVLIPIDAAGNVLLVKQWRAGAEQVLLELPAGVIEAGESPQTAAEREIREETGMRCENLLLLGESYVSPGYCSERFFFFLARELTADPLPCDEDEILDLIKVPLASIRQNPAIRQDMKTWLGILAVLDYLAQS